MPSRGMAGAALHICCTFSASDIRRTRSFTRAAAGCETSFQISGPATTGSCRTLVSPAKATVVERQTVKPASAQRIVRCMSLNYMAGMMYANMFFIMYLCAGQLVVHINPAVFVNFATAQLQCPDGKVLFAHLDFHAENRLLALSQRAVAVAAPGVALGEAPFIAGMKFPAAVEQQPFALTADVGGGQIRTGNGEKCGDKKTVEKKFGFHNHRASRCNSK